MKETGRNEDVTNTRTKGTRKNSVENETNLIGVMIEAVCALHFVFFLSNPKIIFQVTFHVLEFAKSRENEY